MKNAAIFQNNPYIEVQNMLIENVPAEGQLTRKQIVQLDAESGHVDEHDDNLMM